MPLGHYLYVYRRSPSLEVRESAHALLIYGGLRRVRGEVFTLSQPWVTKVIDVYLPYLFGFGMGGKGSKVSASVDSLFDSH